MNNSSIHQFLMKHAPFLALFFIVEYTLSFAVIQVPVLALLLLPMKFVTPFLLYWFIKKLRNQELGGVIRGLHAWTYGVQLMLFAGLIEAAFIFVYHSVIDPDAALRLQQYQFQALEQLQPFLGSDSASLSEMMAQAQEAPLPTAIEMAVSMLTNDIMIGMFLMLLVAPIVRRRAVQE